MSALFGWAMCKLGFHKLVVKRLFASGENDFWPFDVCERGCGYCEAKEEYE